MHGVTRSIGIPFRFARPPGRSPESGWMILNVIGGLRLARKDFGNLGGGKFNSWFNQARNATMADTLAISIELEGWRADAASQRPQTLEAAIERVRTGGVEAQLDRLRQLKPTKSAEEFAGYFHGGDLLVRGLITAGQTTQAVALSRGLTELFPT